MHVLNYHTGLPRFHFDENATTTATTTTTTAAAWHAGLDGEIVGKAQSKGWDMTDPVKAFQAAVTAYSGAEKLVGAPPDKILRMPEASADPAVLDAFWQRLGAAKDAKEIDFSAIKSADGKPLDDKLAEVIRSTALSARAPKEVALSIAAAMQKHFDGEAAAANTIRAGETANQQAALKNSWGANWDRNMFVANQALEKLAQATNMPVDKAKAAWDSLSKLGGVGASEAVNMLFEIGKRMGEDRFVSNGTNGQNLPMTRESAISEITSLKADAIFRDKLLKGDSESTKRWTALHKIGYGHAA